MCTGIIEKTEIEGQGKGRDAWFGIREANVSYDHPYHMDVEHSLNIDFVSASGDPAARVAVEMTFESARRLVETILATLERGAEAEGREARELAEARA